MTNLFEDLQKTGVDALTALVAEAREESLHLEFKQVADPASETLSKEDRKRIAKAICGMANAEGGLVIVGVATHKVEGLDVAAGLAPMAKAAGLRSRLTSALPELLGPQHPGLSVEFIPTGTDQSMGVLVVRVPPSERRPHMSVPEQRYYRRGSQGTAVMLHGEVRDLMLAQREGALELTVSAQGGTIYGGRTYQLKVVIGLRNVGQVPVRAPFLRVKGYPTSIHPEAQNQGFVQKVRDLEGAIYVANADTVLHVEDEVRVAMIASGIHFGDLGSETPWEHVAAVAAGSVEERFIVGDFPNGRPVQHGQFKDQTFEIETRFGAENVQISRPTPRFFGRADLFPLFRNFVRR